jgi:Flp pilus assembly pilin Flp
MSNLLSKFVADESGAGAVEYALVLLLALALVTLVTTTLKPYISTLISTIGGKLTTGVNNIS